jgi:SAM-dependent methyltransferase
MRELIQRVRNLEIIARRRLGFDNHANVFEAIYRGNKWRVGSGPGSTVEDTVPYREFLSDFLKSRRIASVLDLGCGDWQFSRLIDWSGVRYIGADVSETALSSARQHSAPNVSFQVLNAIEDPLPSSDLLIAKDVLQHWSNEDILSFLPKLANFRFALITNGFPPNKTRYINMNIRPGKGRPIDLSRPPFNLSGTYVFEYSGFEPKRVFLWSRPE